MILYYLFFVLGFGFFKGSEQAMYGMAGEHLTTNVRKELMEGIIYKQLSWFDSETKAPGMLTNIMAEDMSALNGMTTETISVMVQGFLGMILSFVLALYFSWRTALFTLLCSPILMIGVFGMSRLQWGNKGGSNTHGTKEADDYSKANALLSDSIMNYKTVMSFGQKNINYLIERFNEHLVSPSQQRIKNAHKSGILFGYSQASRVIFVGLAFWIGSRMICNYDVKKADVFLAVFVLFSAGFGVGTSFSNLPSISKAKASAQKIFAIIDEKSTLDIREETPDQLTKI